MEIGEERGATRQDETGQGGKFNQHLVHLFEQKVGVLLAEDLHALWKATGRCRHLSAKIEDFALKAVQSGQHHLPCSANVGSRTAVLVPAVKGQGGRTNRSERGVHFVAKADRLKTKIGLGATAAVHQSGGAVVPGPGVDAGDADHVVSSLKPLSRVCAHQSPRRHHGTTRCPPRLPATQRPPRAHPRHRTIAIDPAQG